MSESTQIVSRNASITDVTEEEFRALPPDERRALIERARASDDAFDSARGDVFEMWHNGELIKEAEEAALEAEVVRDEVMAGLRRAGCGRDRAAQQAWLRDTLNRLTWRADGSQSLLMLVREQAPNVFRDVYAVLSNDDWMPAALRRAYPEWGLNNVAFVEQVLIWLTVWERSGLADPLDLQTTIEFLRLQVRSDGVQGIVDHLAAMSSEVLSERVGTAVLASIYLSDAACLQAISQAVAEGQPVPTIHGMPGPDKWSLNDDPAWKEAVQELALRGVFAMPPGVPGWQEWIKVLVREIPEARDWWSGEGSMQWLKPISSNATGWIAAGAGIVAGIGLAWWFSKD